MATYSFTVTDEYIAEHDAMKARIVKMEAAIRKAVKHAEANGMNDWPVFVGLRMAVGDKTA